MVVYTVESVLESLPIGVRTVDCTNRVINVNGYPCSLLSKDDYYSTELMSTIEHELQERSLAPMYAGVYGIYDGDELLYIGSTTCLIERWKEHNQNFRTKSFSSKLYSAGR